MTTETDTETTTAPPVVEYKTTFNFLDLAGIPIEGLKVKVTVDGKAFELQTDKQGYLPALTSAADLPLRMEVQRFDGSYKTIDESTTGHSDGYKTYTSPSIVFEVMTELHAGEPGDIESHIPTFEDGDQGVVQTENEEPPVSDTYRDEGRNHPQYVAAPAKGTPHTTQLPDPARAVAPKTGKHAPLKSGRDSNGNPMVVYAEKVKDWWGRWSFPWLQTAQAQAHNTTAKVTYSGTMEAKVKALIDTATTLTEHEIPGTTATYLAMAKTGQKKLEEYTRKPIELSKSWCYKYVKIALVQAHVVDDAPGGVSASEAGPELLRLGFTEVTDTMPDARWAAAGDVIVYRWSDATWERKRRNEPSKPNYGHIDIRSYEAYISDFIPASKRPGWSDYTNIRIYRKVFDPLPTVRIRAFLHCLRDYECQAERDESKRYGMLNCPLPNGAKTFSNYKEHPWQGQPIPDAIKQKKASTAAGAYQITLDTWKDAAKALWSNPATEKDLFSPLVQDRMAVALLESTNKALSLVRTGKTEDAVSALSGRWSSLPGGVHNVSRRTADGKPMDMVYFMSIYNQYLSEEKLKEHI